MTRRIDDIEDRAFERFGRTYTVRAITEVDEDGNVTTLPLDAVEGDQRVEGYAVYRVLQSGIEEHVEDFNHLSDAWTFARMQALGVSRDW